MIFLLLCWKEQTRCRNTNLSSIFWEKSLCKCFCLNTLRQCAFSWKMLLHWRISFLEIEVFLLHNFLSSPSFCNFRVMVMENVNKPQLWNIFNQVTMHSQEVRHHRFCLRLMLKNPDNHALCVLNGHNAFVSGSFKHALGKCPRHDFVKCGWSGG